jgi:hypothetical protein
VNARDSAITAYAVSRILYGAGLLAAPRRVAASWLGDGLERAAGRVGARALGARDALMAAGLLDARRRGGDPLPWLAGLAASDLADIGATLADRDDLPDHAAPATVVVAGAFCAWGLALARAYADA